MRARYSLWIGLITSFVVGLTVQTGHAKSVIRLTNGEWAPYFSEHLPHYGIGSRIVSEAFALEGITVEYTFLPWKRGLFLAQNGDYGRTHVL